MAKIMDRPVYLILFCILALGASSCSKTPIDTVKSDVKLYLNRKYNKPFKIIEYTQLLSNEGNGFADHHVLKAAPEKHPGNVFPIEIRYEGNVINIFRDGYFMYTEDGRRAASTLKSITEKYSNKYAVQIKELGLTKIGGRKSLRNYHYDRKAYPYQFYLSVSIFTDQKNSGKFDPLLYSDIISAFRDKAECLRIDTRYYPASMYKDGITFAETQAIRPSRIGSVQLNKRRLNEFNGQFLSIRKYYERSADMACPTYYM